MLLLFANIRTLCMSLGIMLGYLRLQKVKSFYLLPSFLLLLFPSKEGHRNYKASHGNANLFAMSENPNGPLKSLVVLIVGAS